MNHHTHHAHHHLRDPHHPSEPTLTVGRGTQAETRYTLTTHGKGAACLYSVSGSVSQVVGLLPEEARALGNALLAAAAHAEFEQQCDDDHQQQMDLQAALHSDDHDDAGPLAVGYEQIQGALAAQRAGHAPAWAEGWLPTLTVQYEPHGGITISAQEHDIPFTTDYARMSMDRSGFMTPCTCIWWVDEQHDIATSAQPWLAVMNDFGTLVCVSGSQRFDWHDARSHEMFLEQYGAAHA